MRNKLFWVAVAVAGVAASGTARAQIEVHDTTSLLQQVKSYFQDIKSYAVQTQQYLTAAQQLAQEVQTFNALVQNPSLGGALGLMGQTGLGNDLPINPYGLVGLTSGYSMSLSGMAGKLAALGSLSNASYAQNHIYDCTDNSWACTQQKQRGYGLAGASGIAQAAYQDLRQHMPVVEALRARAATATTPAERENVALALQSETAWHDNLLAQINAAQMQARTDEGNLVQQDNEKTSQALQSTIDSIQ